MADVFEDRQDLAPHRERLWEIIGETPNLDWLLLTKRPELVSSLAPWREEWPTNVWLGATAENQRALRVRLDVLATIPAAVRFLSCEPLLGALDIASHARSIDWVIAGGETGPRSRPSHPAWFEGLRDQCLAAGVAFHFKQWGDWVPGQPAPVEKVITWGGRRQHVFRVGKKAAGRLLDGRTWDGLPVSRSHGAPARMVV